jgi:hypothetical protein
MTPRQRTQFDPRAILAALERGGVDYVLIGGLAQVIRGADVVTTGADICPSFSPGNLERLSRTAKELNAADVEGGELELTEATLGAEPVIALSTPVGSLHIVASPTGAPKGFVDLRRAATKEHLGHGVQPLVASTGDLARMASALHRDRDIQRLRQLRRIIELEADREQLGQLPQPTRQTTRTAARPARRAQR